MFFSDTPPEAMLRNAPVGLKPSAMAIYLQRILTKHWAVSLGAWVYINVTNYLHQTEKGDIHQRKVLTTRSMVTLAGGFHQGVRTPARGRTNCGDNGGVKDIFHSPITNIHQYSMNIHHHPGRTVTLAGGFHRCARAGTSCAGSEGRQVGSPPEP